MVAASRPNPSLTHPVLRCRSLNSEICQTEASRAIEPQLCQIQSPTLIVWGTDDIYFLVRWAHWPAKTIPGAKRPVELKGVRIFFPEERADVFNRLLRAHLLAS